MRILLLAPQPFFVPRGTPINVRLLCRSLSDLGHEVDLLTLPYGDDVQIPRVTIRRLWKIPGIDGVKTGPSGAKLLYDLLMAAAALWLAVTRRYDALHGIEEAAFICWGAGRITGTPSVFDMDSHITDQLRYSKFMNAGWLLRLVERIETASLKGAAAVVTVCEALTEVAARYVERERIEQVEDIPQELPDPPEGVTPESLRAEFGIGSDAPLLLYTGNLEAYQGIDLLLEAAVEVARGVPEARFLVVGGDAASLLHYRARAAELALGTAVVFAGPRPLSHMAPLMAAADILCSPRTEGTNTPLKIYTYLAAGRAIVATDLPTHTQALNADVAVLTAATPMAYAEGILLLLKDGALRRSLGDRGGAYVRERFNYESFRSKVEAAYRRIGAAG